MNAFLLLSTLNLSLGGLVFLLGFLILRENPGQRLNRVVALMLFFGGLGAVFAALSFMASRGGTMAAPGTLRDLSYMWELFFPTLFLFASIFPEERAFVRRPLLRIGRRWSVGFAPLIFVPHVFHFFFVLAASSWRPDVQATSLGPFHYLGALATLLGLVVKLFFFVHRALFSLVNLGFGLATMALLFDSYRRTRVPRLRQQIGVVALGLSASLVLYSAASSIPTLLGLQLAEDLRASLTFAALTLGPGSIAYAVVRHKFLDAKLLARRGILYALSSAALVGLYLAVAERLTRALSAAAGTDVRVVESVMLIVALALSQPAVAWLESMLDRAFLKDPGDYRNVLRRLAGELQTTIDLDALLGRTITTLTEAMLLRTGHVVVFGRDTPIGRSGAGAALDRTALERISLLLGKVPAGEGSFRVADPVEGLGPGDRAFLAALGISLVVPLRWQDDLVGALLLGEKHTGTPLTSEDAALLATLAGQVSVSLQNALLLRDRVAVARFEEELNLARQIQRNSLLSEFPVLRRCEVHALTLPSKHVGGDLYDVVEAGDGSWFVAIADVSGKGVPAALLSSMLQASLRTQAANVRSPAEILRNINHLMYRSTAVQQFATFFLARVDGERMELWFSNAGHNWPVLLRQGDERRFLERGGLILGFQERVEFEEERVSLLPGDLVVLYTDGISEAADAAGEQFGEERLYAALSAMPRTLSAREVTERVLATLREFLDGTEAQDDITLLVLKVLDPAAQRAGVEPARMESSAAELATRSVPSGR
jgi:sigma-B regulation protein RsbU (phosphoserine phosphatase)